MRAPREYNLGAVIGSTFVPALELPGKVHGERRGIAVLGYDALVLRTETEILPVRSHAGTPGEFRVPLVGAISHRSAAARIGWRAIAAARVLVCRQIGLQPGDARLAVHIEEREGHRQITDAEQRRCLRVRGRVRVVVAETVVTAVAVTAAKIDPLGLGSDEGYGTNADNRFPGDIVIVVAAVVIATADVRAADTGADVDAQRVVGEGCGRGADRSHGKQRTPR